MTPCTVSCAPEGYGMDGLKPDRYPSPEPGVVLTPKLPVNVAGDAVDGDRRIEPSRDAARLVNADH